MENRLLGGNWTTEKTGTLTQCVDGWQCGACGLSGVEREPVPRMNAVPLEVTCSGYVQGKLPWARNCSKMGISSARCSSAAEKRRNGGFQGCIREINWMPELRSREWPLRGFFLWLANFCDRDRDRSRTGTRFICLLTTWSFFCGNLSHFFT